MAEITLNIGVSGLDTIDADVKAELNKVVTATFEALKDVQADMKESLAAHIQKDVYQAYPRPHFPVEYKRRIETGAGTPIIDMEKNVDPIGPFNRTDANGGGYGTVTITAGIDYNPNGYYVDRPDWSNVDENELIDRIEKGKDAAKPYEWFPKIISAHKRPFWQKFVTEQTDGNALGDSFVRAMAMRGIVISGDATVIREAQDGDY